MGIWALDRSQTGETFMILAAWTLAASRLKYPDRWSRASAGFARSLSLSLGSVGAAWATTASADIRIVDNCIMAL